jgi:hypothetical protein
MRCHYEVADVLNKAWEYVENSTLNTWQIRTLRAVKDCRTPALGGHVDACDACGLLRISYNSCRNRHCPKCQGHKREAWIEARVAELLPVPYFHVVFTLPQELNPLALHQPKAVYDALFSAAWATIEAFSGKHKAGMISILHTWGQNLSLHPHIHCIIPGGTLMDEGTWVQTKNKGKFLYPVKALSKVFRAKYLSMLRKRVDKQQIPKALFAKNWVVYAKRPFGSHQSVIEYLGRYTHKIAISNHRIVAVDDQTVRFTYKDYKAGGIKKTMSLAHGEFIRRFGQHILPKRFVRIRHYGILSSTWKREKLILLQAKLLNQAPAVRPVVVKKQLVMSCPSCKTGRMHIILTFSRREPPACFIGKNADQKTTVPTA